MKDRILHDIEESGRTELIAPALFANPDQLCTAEQLRAREVV